MAESELHEETEGLLYGFWTMFRRFIGRTLPWILGPLCFLSSFVFTPHFGWETKIGHSVCVNISECTLSLPYIEKYINLEVCRETTAKDNTPELVWQIGYNYVTGAYGETLDIIIRSGFTYRTCSISLVWLWRNLTTKTRTMFIRNRKLSCSIIRDSKYEWIEPFFVRFKATNGAKGRERNRDAGRKRVSKTFFFLFFYQNHSHPWSLEDPKVKRKVVAPPTPVWQANREKTLNEIGHSR